MAFSATWPTGVRRLSKSYLKNPMMVYVGTLDLAVSYHKQFLQLVGNTLCGEMGIL